jgi:FtsP/CotA-like multicopper oxidase with cupredoxin domain
VKLKQCKSCAYHGPGSARGQTGEQLSTTIPIPTRREFLSGALAISGVALSGVPQPALGQSGSGEAQRIGEIVSQNRRLRAVIAIRNGNRTFPAGSTPGSASRTRMLRYFEGKDSAGNMWPPANRLGELLPGPTLRARVGDQVEITFLNHVKVEDFPGGTLDRAETGQDTGCDIAVEVDGTQVYPGGAGDKAPNCFHGSSTANIHFHGTHVTPDGLGDNVLLQLRPNPRVIEALVQKDFAQIFQTGPPARWSDLPNSWRNTQLGLLKQYDDTAVWKGRRGTPGNPALPVENRLLPPALAAIKRGQWPQYQIGAYPYCFKLTEYAEDANGKPTRYQMGQSPGTHWYHAHKHGSTAINVYNGMAGVFVIEGKEYDDALLEIYPKLKETEKVLIVQQFSEAPNTAVGRGDTHSLFINGQLNPTITMRKGEIQLWRMVNATVKAVTSVKAFTRTSGSGSDLPVVRQIAQDGVQFHWDNYKSQPLQSLSSTFAPGNRMDILVKAPEAPGSYVLALEDTTNTNVHPVLTLTVAEDAASSPMDFPTEANYPAQPRFLKDIDEATVRIRRTLDFGWESGRSGPGPTGNPARAPKFMIDGRQFLDGRYDQTMVLGDAEEWTLTNSTSTIAHPFHIHVNPFQVVERFDPSTNTLYKPEKNFVWQDVIAIPPSVLDSTGKVVKDDQGREKRGYVKIRHRFVDFPGSYVLHCHMLAHEDRGMMQLVRVISAETATKHH